MTVVEIPDWAGAFEAIERAGKVAGLVGRARRVSGASAEEVREILAAIPARVYETPATLEERFLELTRPGAGTAATAGSQHRGKPARARAGHGLGTGTDAPPFPRSRWIFRQIKAKLKAKRRNRRISAG